MSIWFIQRQKCDGTWEPMMPPFHTKECAEEDLRQAIQYWGRYQVSLRIWEYVPKEEE